MAIKVDIDYTPQPKQSELHTCAANEILFGGAAGPGKSHALRFEALIWCLRIPNLQVYLFRRTGPELDKNHILPSQQQFPQSIGTYKIQARRWEFKNGSMLHFCHAQYEHDVFSYQGAEIHLLFFDELTTFTEFQYDYLRSRVRCTLDIPAGYKHKIPGIIAASNPGGVGHSFCKRRWVDFAPAMELKRAPKAQGGMLRCYIPGKLSDNKILLDHDPDYINRLDALPEPYRSAYKDGDWDIFLGQAFNFAREHHVCPAYPIPDTAPLYMSFDWGYGKPFDIGWYWIDQDGRIYRFAEWYGSNGTPDQGLRLTDSEIADGIIKRERQLGIDRRDVYRLCDPTCFNRKPDYRGGGQGPSTADEFAERGLFLTAGDASRKLKIRQFHQRLRLYDDCKPMFQVYDCCEHFIRTIPLLQSSRHDPEDIDTTMEDHCYDSTALIFMSRPVSMAADKVSASPYDKRIDNLINGRANSYDEYATRDGIETINDLYNSEVFRDGYDY